MFCPSHGQVFCVKTLVLCTSVELTASGSLLWRIWPFRPCFACWLLVPVGYVCRGFYSEDVLADYDVTRITSRFKNRFGKSGDLEEFTYKLAVRVRKLGQTRYVKLSILKYNWWKSGILIWYFSLVFRKLYFTLNIPQSQACQVSWCVLVTRLMNSEKEISFISSCFTQIGSDTLALQ